LARSVCIVVVLTDNKFAIDRTAVFAKHLEQHMTCTA